MHHVDHYKSRGIDKRIAVLFLMYLSDDRQNAETTKFEKKSNYCFLTAIAELRSTSDRTCLSVRIDADNGKSECVYWFGYLFIPSHEMLLNDLLHV